MALPIAYRWITVGNVVLRNSLRTPGNAPAATFQEVMEVAKKRFSSNTYLRQYAKSGSRLMWFSNIVEQNGFYWFLAEVGDQNITDFSLLNFKTLKPRDVKKREDEGGYYTAHVAISTKPLSKTSGHLILAEKVPGVYLGSLKDHFTWLGSESNLHKTYVDKDGHPKTAVPVFEVDGYESGTIGDALRTGVLQDIEFVRTSEHFEDGLDEESVVRQSVHEARWVVKQKVDDAQASSVFSRARAYFPKFGGVVHGDAKIFVRIKTEAGQIRQTEIDPDVENVLEQAFVRNEIVKEFSSPLSQRHSGLRSDMMEKMIAIAKDIEKRDKIDA